jgi:hypothetical protein
MNRNLFTRVAGFVAVLGAARSAAAAVEGHRRPVDRDLTALGIDPVAFRAIGR